MISENCLPKGEENSDICLPNSEKVCKFGLEYYDIPEEYGLDELKRLRMLELRTNEFLTMMVKMGMLKESDESSKFLKFMADEVRRYIER